MGNEYVRHTDPATSYRGSYRVIPKLPERRRQCYEVVDRLGPCTRNEIYTLAFSDAKALGMDDIAAHSFGESIRRRVTDLLYKYDPPILYVLDGTGDSEILWFDQGATVFNFPSPLERFLRSLIRRLLQ